MSLFSPAQPLADRMRPRDLDGFYGQEHLVGKDRLIRKAIDDDKVSSMILWGPPGSGKTTLARVIANSTNHEFVSFSAVLQGVKDVRELVTKARDRLKLSGRRTILFVDEIHRFNRSQQDAFLPHVESGVIILIGATTENPSFSINNALLSRCRTYTLKALTDADISEIITRALTDREHGYGKYAILLENEARELLVNFANGDARAALGSLELAVTGSLNDGENKSDNSDSGDTENKDAQIVITLDIIKEAITSRIVAYDKSGDEHYNLISAFHKSIRGSDPQGALYWLARMLEGGEDPLYIARRLVRMASEDIGLADPSALPQAIAARDAAHFLGMPECNCALTQCAVYLATAPKSNKCETAYAAAVAAVRETRNESPPMHILNAPTKLMKELGYHEGYQYDHDCPDSFSGQEYLPDALRGSVFYEPGQYGYEKEIQKRLAYWQRLKEKRNNNRHEK